MDTIQVNPISELEEMVGQDAICQTTHGLSSCVRCREFSQCSGRAEFVAISPCCGRSRLKCAECLEYPWGWVCPLCDIEFESFAGVRPV